MATTLKPLYSSLSSGTSIGLNAAFSTLANATARGIAAIDNTTNLYLDAMIYISVTVGTVSGSQAVNVFFAGSEDGSTFTDNYGGTDATVTLRSPTNLRGPFSIATPSSTTTYAIVIPSFNRYFGSRFLPKKWGFVIDNESGAAFTACSAEYTGVNFQSV
jgi:hypothetical protein